MTKERGIKMNWIAKKRQQKKDHERIKGYMIDAIRVCDVNKFNRACKLAEMFNYMTAKEINHYRQMLLGHMAN